MVVNGTIDKNGVKSEKNTSATLEEALVLSGFGIYNILHMLMSGLILMGVIMQSLALGYVLPAAQCDLDLTIVQRGWIASIPFLAIILTSYFWGWVADTRGRWPVLLYCMIVSSGLSVVASFSPEIISFAFLSFLSAVFMSAPSSIAYTFLGEFNNIHHRDKMMAFGSSFIGIGTVALPAVSWLILPLEFAFPIPFLGILYRPWRLLIVVCAIPFALCSLLILLMPESPKFLYSVGKYDETLKVVKTIHSVNKRVPADSFPVKSLAVESQATTTTSNSGVKAMLESMKEQTLPLFKPPLLIWTCLTCFVQFGIFATTNGFYLWFPTILNYLANHEGSESRICDVLEASRRIDNETVYVCDDSINEQTFERSIYMGLVFSSMYLVVGVIVDIVGKKMILIVILAATGVCGICANLAYNQQLAIILFAFFQMSGSCIGLMNAASVELFPTKYRAMSVCLCMMTGRIGSMLGSSLIGILIDVNCGASFYMFGSIIIVNSLCCFVLPGRKSNKKPSKEMTIEPTQNQTHEPV